MQTPLQQKINKSLLSNRFFKKLDKVVRFDGKDIFVQWEQYYMKNLGKVTVPRYSELVLEVSNKVREKFNIPKSEHTYIEVKRVEILKHKDTINFRYSIKLHIGELFIMSEVLKKIKIIIEKYSEKLCHIYSLTSENTDDEIIVFDGHNSDCFFQLQLDKQEYLDNVSYISINKTKNIITIDYDLNENTQWELLKDESGKNKNTLQNLEEYIYNHILKNNDMMTDRLNLTYYHLKRI